MKRSLALACLPLFLFGCREEGTGGAGGDGGSPTSTAGSGGGGEASGASGGGGDAPIGGGGEAPIGGAGGAGGSGERCGTPVECAAAWEEAASDTFDDLVGGSPDELAAFLRAMPKGADLHNHLSGAVYAETYLEWAKDDGDCINSSTFAAVTPAQCSATNQPVPSPGPFYDSIVRAWSMEDFVPGAESGHDHFFATFGKFGLVAGAHRAESIADVLTRAAAENQLYVELMFNLGKNVGDLAALIWSGTLDEGDLPALYASLKAHPNFDAELAKDVQVVEDAMADYRAVLGCDDVVAPAACDVGVRFIAQVSRTGGKDLVFGQLVSSYEMAALTDGIVGANLSSPEDDPTSLANYDLHMSMLDLLHGEYTETGLSPLHITLHAGELTEEFLPPGSTHNTFHIRAALDTGHAERIGHGLDVMSETNPTDLMSDLRDANVLVEICLSSNAQILEVEGADHPLAEYIAHEVPVALATDDQGVSRSSLAGEFVRAALDQQLDYRRLKRMARDSLEHAFLPGASLWASIADATPVGECTPTDTTSKPALTRRPRRSASLATANDARATTWHTPSVPSIRSASIFKASGAGGR